MHQEIFLTSTVSTLLSLSWASRVSLLFLSLFLSSSSSSTVTRPVRLTLLLFSSCSSRDSNRTDTRSRSWPRAWKVIVKKLLASCFNDPKSEQNLHTWASIHAVTAAAGCRLTCNHCVCSMRDSSIMQIRLCDSLSRIGPSGAEACYFLLPVSSSRASGIGVAVTWPNLPIKSLQSTAAAV